jgi:hypothetical protein
MFGRTAVLIALALALVLPSSAPAREAGLKAPAGLKAFLLSYGEPTKRTFSRTPSFAWKPVLGTKSYEFQLATSTSFSENSILWSSTSLTAPYVSVPLSLPWVTGHPYSLFVRARAKTQRGYTPWTSSYGFNVRWTQIPSQLSAPNGLIRWTPIDGASEYEVLECSDSTCSKGAKTWQKPVFVATNVTDMRDWFTFHQNVTPVTEYWRVRALRITYGTVQNAVPTTSYGPWSPMFQSHATPPTSTRFALSETAADVRAKVSAPVAHTIMPGFAWDGTVSDTGKVYELYRVYVFSDSDCVNPVMTGSIVGSPAWVPRVSGPLALPNSDSAISDARNTVLQDGAQISYDYSGAEITTSEVYSPDSGTSTSAHLDLWDRDWPSGVYYWTIVPVTYGTNSATGNFEYWDAESPQDACAAGRVARFGRVSEAVSTVGRDAYVTSLSLAGKMTSAKAVTTPRVYGNSPLITWISALGADEYELQWARKRSALSSTTNIITPATSATPALAPGTWYYRVRGINLDMPSGAQQMSWSSVRMLQIAKPVFRISR